MIIKINVEALVLSYLYLTLIAIEKIEMALFPREYIDILLKYDHTELTGRES